MTTPLFNTETLSLALKNGGMLADRYNALWEKLWVQTHVPPALLDMCRLRLAQMHGVPGEIALSREGGFDMDKIDALKTGSYSSDPRFTATEMAALEFTEIYAQDPMAISDQLADGVKHHFGEAGLVCLLEALGFIEGRIRLSLMFSALNAAPAR